MVVGIRVFPVFYVKKDVGKISNFVDDWGIFNIITNGDGGGGNK